MPAPRDEFVDHCVELLGRLGPCRARRMFGGHGVYVGDVFVALIAGRRLYLKTDAASLPAFAAQGGEPFSFEARGQLTTTSYWTVPDEAMESPERMMPWGRRALDAALLARTASTRKTMPPIKPVAVSRKILPSRP